MKRISNQSGQVLIILLSAIFLGGATTTTTFIEGHSAKDVKKAVKKVVADDSRKDEILELIDTWNKEKKKHDKEVKKGRKSILKIMERYDWTREELQQASSRLDEAIQKIDRNYLDLRFNLKEKITRDEWNAIYARIKE